jgi:hypothetical protein
MSVRGECIPLAESVVVDLEQFNTVYRYLPIIELASVCVAVE